MKILSVASLFLFVTLWTSSCDPSIPKWVWVPALDFNATLQVWIGDEPGQTFRVEDWISLHANRSTGPWIRVAHKDLPPDARWMRKPPEKLEEGVEANARWHVAPDRGHQFNLPKAHDIHTRQIRFSEPGRYKIWADSHTFGGGNAVSNIL